MIDVSLCPNSWVKKKARPYKLVVEWLNTLNALAADQDASGGKLKTALTGSTPLFVTSYQYGATNSFTCLNVMVDRQDYRLIIGFDDRIVRAERLDARSARAQTKSEIDDEARTDASALQLADAHVPVDSGNYNVDEDANYANVENPYNVRIPAP